MCVPLALGMAVLCVRNTCIEDIHAGIEPHSQAGDFSDARVVTPDGEIPWNRLSRIRNDEMREFMKQVVDRIYTVLLRSDDPGDSSSGWISMRSALPRNGMIQRTLPIGSWATE
jgi:hypothetical protein